MTMRCDFVPLLDEWLARFQGKPFVWGEVDCVMVSFGWVKFATGRDIFAPFASWSSKEEAEAAIDAAANTLAECVDMVLEPIEVMRAQVGDLVSFPQMQHNMEPLRICLGTASVFLLPDGMHRVKTSVCNRAWKVL